MLPMHNYVQFYEISKFIPFVVLKWTFSKNNSVYGLEKCQFRYFISGSDFYLCHQMEFASGMVFLKFSLDQLMGSSAFTAMYRSGF